MNKKLLIGIMASGCLSLSASTENLIIEELSPGCSTATHDGKTLQEFQLQSGKAEGKREMLQDIVSAKTIKTVTYYGESAEHIQERFLRDLPTISDSVNSICNDKALAVSECFIESTTLDSSQKIVFEIKKNLSIFQNEKEYEEEIGEKATKEKRKAAHQNYESTTGLKPSRKIKNALNFQISKEFEGQCFQKIQDKAFNESVSLCNKALGIKDEDGVGCEVVSMIPTKNRVSGNFNDQYLCAYGKGSIVTHKPDQWSKGQAIEVHTLNKVTLESLETNGSLAYKGEDFKYIKKHRRKCSEEEQKKIFDFGRATGHKEVLVKWNPIRFVPEKKYENVVAEVVEDAIAQVQERRDLELSQIQSTCKAMAPGKDCAKIYPQDNEIACLVGAEESLFNCNAPSVEFRPKG